MYYYTELTSYSYLICFVQSVPRNPVDMNAYQNKKTLAQGMMDLVLLSANASQLRTVFETEGSHRYYYYGLVMIGISIVLQVIAKYTISFSRSFLLYGASQSVNEITAVTSTV